jgi:hypothetical protein
MQLKMSIQNQEDFGTDWDLHVTGNNGMLEYWKVRLEGNYAQCLAYR